MLNSGSSSIKYSVFEMTGLQVLISGIIEQIGETQSLHKYCLIDTKCKNHKSQDEQNISDHQQGLATIFQLLQKSEVVKQASDLFAIGHRVVHGGEKFHQPTLINSEVITDIEKMIPLAPLHNPANLKGIEVSIQFADKTPQVAIFDTAFHQSIPDHAFHYPIPKTLYQQQKIRRYGFHGTSHYFVAKQAASFLNKPLNTLNLITLHLGNGGSVTAIKQGKSIDTSMGMTPLEGLMMGTRSGDIDPAIPYFLNKNCDMSIDAIDTMLNKQSGLKGICGENDMRAIHGKADQGNKDAKLAIEMYCYRIKKYLGAYCAVLGSVDAIVFTGGIGENDVQIREKVCHNLPLLGISINQQKNSAIVAEVVDIKDDQSALSVLVIQTDEELEIAMQTMNCVKSNRP